MLWRIWNMLGVSLVIANLCVLNYLQSKYLTIDEVGAWLYIQCGVGITAGYMMGDCLSNIYHGD